MLQFWNKNNYFCYDIIILKKSIKMDGFFVGKNFYYGTIHSIFMFLIFFASSLLKINTHHGASMPQLLSVSLYS